MTALEPAKADTAAATRARQNGEANLAALAMTQPAMADAVDSTALNLTWIFGRDGFLTAQDSSGQWWAGCSLPKRAGITMLKKLDIHGVVGCLLAPTHAGQVAAALEKLSLHQAVIVVHPDTESIRVLLGCCDFSADIARHRLWFAIGEQWPVMLGQLFKDQPGLSTPCQFIRTPATHDDLVQELIPLAERVFDECNADRSEQIGKLSTSSELLSRVACDARLAACIATRHGPQADRLNNSMHVTSSNEDPIAPRLLVLAASHFRLWDDAGHALLAAIQGLGISCLDPDDPAQSSSLALALAGQHRDAVIVPNRSRAELPAVLSPSTRVFTWITQPRIPAFDINHPNDALLLADDTWLPAARSLGWPAHRVTVAGWPTLPLMPAAAKCLVLIADTFALDTPVKTLSASSHHLLWDTIRADLASDPFCLGTDIVGFIHRRLTKLGISEEGFDQSMFIDRLIMPAYQQGLAKLLMEADLPLKIYGRGWDELPRFRTIWQGEVDTREKFRSAVKAASVLIYPWPTRVRHEIDAMGLPVLSPHLRRAESWIRDAGAMLNRATESPSLAPISLSLIQELLHASAPV